MLTNHLIYLLDARTLRVLNSIVAVAARLSTDFIRATARSSILKNVVSSPNWNVNPPLSANKQNTHTHSLFGRHPSNFRSIVAHLNSSVNGLLNNIYVCITCVELSANRLAQMTFRVAVYRLIPRSKGAEWG